MLGREPLELLYLSDDRISQVNFPALSGKAAKLKEKHARLFKQENAHDKLLSAKRLTRAVMFKWENFSSFEIYDILCGKGLSFINISQIERFSIECRK